MKSKSFLCLIIFFFNFQPLYPQVYDTISNWDGISAAWVTWPGNIELVSNPQPGDLNLSANCIKLTTSTEPYDLMLLDLPYIVNFDEFPHYQLLCCPPPEGGDVVLKFENSDVSDWQEIRVSTVGGIWNLLNFNFTGLSYNNYTRMVVFFDFLGTSAGKEWYFDDIVRKSAAPLQLQSNLPLIVINTFGAEIPDDPKINATMGIIDHGAGNQNNLGDPFNGYNGNIGIEIRGQSTQMFPKKCYGFETRDSQGENLDVSLLGLPEENDWILYAPYTDKSLMRNTLTYELGHRMGDYCTRNVYCELVINNDYKGIYILQEKIKKDKNRVDIATLNPDEISDDAVTGGYILAVDKLPWDFEYGTDGWISSPNPSYPNAMDITFQYYYPEPEDIVSQQREYIRNYVSTAEKALIASNFKDPFSGYLKYFDAPSFVDFMLLSEISKEVDKYRYSTYFNKQKDSDGGKLFAGPAWDFNLGYGNVDYWPEGTQYTGWLYELVYPWDGSMMFWWKRMMEDPYFRNLTQTRWNSLRQSKLSDSSIQAVIDSLITLTAGARERNFERWPVLGQYVWPNYNWQGNDYEDEVTYFTNYLFNRLAWMDSNINGEVLHPVADIVAVDNQILLTLKGDYFRSPVLKKGNFSLNHTDASVEITGVEYKNAVSCTLTISENVTSMPELSVTVDKKCINTWDDLISNQLATASANEGSGQFLVNAFTSNGIIHLRCPEPDILPASATLYNITGQKINEFLLQNSTENLIPAPGTSGIYILKFVDHHHTFSIKVLVP